MSEQLTYDAARVLDAYGIEQLHIVGDVNGRDAHHTLSIYH